MKQNKSIEASAVPKVIRNLKHLISASVISKRASSASFFRSGVSPFPSVLPALQIKRDELFALHNSLLTVRWPDVGSSRTMAQVKLGRLVGYPHKQDITTGYHDRYQTGYHNILRKAMHK
jgi:hypothetical protein